MEFVDVDVVKQVATVTLNRPPVNALSAQVFRELGEVFRSFATSTEVNAAILTGHGDRVFCGGVDLRDSARRYAREEADGDTVVDRLDPGSVVRDCFFSLYDCAVPVIGAINGAAAGAGVSLVASCDVLIAAENARLALPEINAGVAGGVRHLQRLVGPQKARLMAFTGDWAPADELYRVGAVEKVVPADELMPTAREMAERIAAKSPIGVRILKESCNRVEDLPMNDGYRLEQDYTSRTKQFHDSDEARLAFLEKREPAWTWT